MTGPGSLNAYVTRRCTNRCTFCTGKGQGDAPDLDVDVLEAALDTFPTIRSVCVAGLGEPLLSKTTPELAALSLGRGLFTSLITNGHLVREKAIPYERFGYINVSVNAITAEEYERRSGVDAFDEVEAAVRHLVSVKARVGVSFVVTRQTARRVPSWLRWSAVMRAAFVSLVNVLPQPGEQFSSWAHDYLRPEDLCELDAWRSLARSIGVHVNAWPVAVPVDHETRDLGGPSPCRSPHETIGVDGAGNVTGCQRLLGPDGRFGNVLRHGEGAWQTAHFESLRAELTAGRPNPLCRRCFGSWAS